METQIVRDYYQEFVELEKYLNECKSTRIRLENYKRESERKGLGNYNRPLTKISGNIYQRGSDRYYVRVERNGVLYTKSFLDLDDAIEYRDEILEKNVNKKQYVIDKSLIEYDGSEKYISVAKGGKRFAIYVYNKFTGKTETHYRRTLQEAIEIRDQIIERINKNH